MKFRIPFLLVAAVGLLLSCDKDTFETKPSIKIKSISPEVVPEGAQFAITIEYTDKEGDVNDSIFIKKEILNENQAGQPQVFTDINAKIPEFPENRKGEIAATFQLNRSPSAPYILNMPAFQPPSQQNDTVVFHIYVKDKGGNYSDTITSQKVVFVKL